MPKTPMMAACAALLAAAPLALAAPPTTAAPGRTSVTATRIEPGQIRATDLKGSDVYDTHNQKVGSIKDIILDHSGQVAAVVLAIDGKNVAVGMKDLNIAMNRDNTEPQKVTVDMTKNQLKSQGAFQLENKSAASGGSIAPRPATAPKTHKY